MFKALVTVSSLSLGGAAVGAILYMQSNPLAFAEPTGLPSADDEVAIRAPELPLRLGVRHEGVQIPQVAAVRVRPLAPRLLVLAVRPCSQWWSLGPKAVALGPEPSHNVRALCP